MMIKARRLVRDVDDLPTIPVIVSKIIGMLDEGDADSDAIADLMLSDQVLAARIVRLVNSPLYRPASEITSVKRALMYLGFKSVREMLQTSYFVNAFKGRKEAFDIRIFWIHSFTVGAISRRIAGKVGYHDDEKAHLVGIIHDIGKVFLGHYCTDEYAAMLETIRERPVTTYQAEIEAFGTSHCEVGLCLAQRWGFPPVYTDIISHHHNSVMATEDPLLTAVVTLADYCSLIRTPASGIAQATEAGHSEESAWSVLRQLSNKPLPGDFKDFMLQLDGDFEATSNEVRQLFDSMAVR